MGVGLAVGLLLLGPLLGQKTFLFYVFAIGCGGN